MEDDKVSNQNQTQGKIELTITIADPYHFVHVESLIDNFEVDRLGRFFSFIEESQEHYLCQIRGNSHQNYKRETN